MPENEPNLKEFLRNSLSLCMDKVSEALLNSVDIAEENEDPELTDALEKYHDKISEAKVLIEEGAKEAESKIKEIEVEVEVILHLLEEEKNKFKVRRRFIKKPN